MKKYLFLSYALIFLDQITKMFVLMYLQEPISLISDIFQLTLRFNEGVAFSISIFQPILIPLLLLIIICGTILAYFYLDWDNKFQGFSFSCIFAGAIGNFIDRIFHGQVVDFIKISIWPVFNVADIFITIGVIIAFYDIIFIKKKPKKRS